MKKQLTQTEVDGDKLKLAREAQGLGHKELALKLCLSHQHIAQLEGNQLSIFFTHTHKIQVAKKVGTALGLSEDDYLIQRAIGIVANENASTLNQASISKLPPEDAEFFVKSGIKPKQPTSRLLFISLLALSTMAIATGSQIFSSELSDLKLDQLISLKTPMSEFKAFPPSTAPSESPVVESLDPNQEGSLSAVSVIKELNPCSYQEQETPAYRTPNPSKPAEMVYVVSKERQTLCVIDGQNQAVSLDLAAGQSRSVYGQAPFTVISSDLSKFDLYFQGWKVKPATSEAKAIRLEATKLALN